MSLNSDVKMIRSVIFQVQVYRCRKSFWIFWRIFNEVSPRKYVTQIHLVLHRFQIILCKKRTFWILPSDHPILWLLHCEPTSSPNIVRSLSIHVLLPSSTGSLDHERMPISPKRWMRFQSCVHSEFLQNAPISISIWYWIRPEFPRSSYSCRFPSSPNNLFQDEWLLSLTKTWTFLHLKSFVFNIWSANVEHPAVKTSFAKEMEDRRRVFTFRWTLRFYHHIP